MGFYKRVQIKFCFSTALNEALKVAGKSQYWLARELGVSEPYVSKISNGSTVPSIAKTGLIAATLEMSLSEFIALGESTEASE